MTCMAVVVWQGGEGSSSLKLFRSVPTLLRTCWSAWKLCGIHFTVAQEIASEDLSSLLSPRRTLLGRFCWWIENGATNSVNRTIVFMEKLSAHLGA